MGQFISSRADLARAFKRTAMKPFQQVLGSIVRGASGAKTPPGTLLDPTVVFWLMGCVATSKDGTMRSASGMFSKIVGSVRPSNKDEPFSAAALCTARTRVGVSFFEKIFAEFVEKFRARFGYRFRWRNFCLVGIDGTTLNLPGNAKDLLKKFPPSSGSKGEGVHPQMLMVALVDLWTGLARRFETGPKKGGRGENAYANLLASSLDAGDLLLGDSNFPAYELFARTRLSGAQFLIRRNSWRFSALSHRRIPLEDSREYLMEIAIPPKVAKQSPELPETMVVRVLEKRLENGKRLSLMTSLLDPIEYPYEELIDLYLERWHQETAHRDWKHSLKLSNLRSKKEEGILQEINLQLTLNNVLRWIQAEAIPLEPERDQPQAPIDLRYKDSLRAVEVAAEEALVRHPSELPQLYLDLVERISRLRIKKRPGRSYPRTKKEIVQRRTRQAGDPDLISHAPT